MRIYFDIETVPSQIMGAREAARAGVKPPGSYKKPETIAAWWQDEGEAAVERAYRAQALDASVGEIASISWAADDGDVQTAIRAHGEDERIVLVRFFAGVQSLIDAASIPLANGQDPWQPDPYFIAHNAPFDLGFIWRRSAVLGIRPPWKMPTPAAREGKDYGCTMRLWAGPRDTISLDRLCTALGIQSPKSDDMDGGKVYDAWRAGELDRIAEYNRQDVLAVRAIWHRLNWEGGDHAA